MAMWYDAIMSVAAVQSKFCAQFDRFRRRVPTRGVIVRVHERLLTTGSVLPAPGKQRDRTPPRPARTTSTEQRVIAAFEKSPNKSLRRGAQELELSKDTVHRILREAKMKPYRIQIMQALNDEDIDHRLEFSEIMLNRFHEDENLLDQILFSDEAIFKLNGGVNKQNCRYWCDENPHFYSEQGLHAPQVVVWCGLWARGLIGPFFFDGTVNGENYLGMLKDWLLPQIQGECIFDRMIFMQDGAPPHFSKDVRAWLHNTFPERWMGRRGPIEWPPRSPDLTPLDFFLWGYLKSVVYAKHPKSLDELKQQIATACADLNQNRSILDKALVAVKKRLERCVEHGGGHVEQFC